MKRTKKLLTVLLSLLMALSVCAVAFAADGDGYVFPVLAGTRFYGYDKSVIRMVGGMMFPVGEGTTRVFLDWNGIRSDCLVHVVSGD